MSTLTPEEKVRIRHHTGYTNAATVATAVLGSPSSIETMFIIEQAMNVIRPEAEPQIRRHMQILDGIEAQMIDDLELLAVSAVDEITIRPDEQGQLEGRYLYWRDSLCNLLGIFPNPFDKRFMNSGINTGVHN